MKETYTIDFYANIDYFRRSEIIIRLYNYTHNHNEKTVKYKHCTYLIEGNNEISVIIISNELILNTTFVCLLKINKIILTKYLISFIKGKFNKGI